MTINNSYTQTESGQRECETGTTSLLVGLKLQQEFLFPDLFLSGQQMSIRY